MMKESCDQLKLLLTELPVYPYGKISQVASIHSRYTDILIKAPSQATSTLRGTAVDIDTLIDDYRKAKTKKNEKWYFDKATNDLRENIIELIDILDCDSPAKPK